MNPIGTAGIHLFCIPQVVAPRQTSYGATFRRAISQFLDRFNFDLGGVKRSCVHYVELGGAFCTFDTFNSFFRPGAPARAHVQRLRSHA
jgi:7,8-dihydro-6-hydroxymethylpterin dimethyltransferase